MSDPTENLLPNILDADALIRRLYQKKDQEPTWTINSRESTPEYFYQPNGDEFLEFWKFCVLDYEDRLRKLNPRKDYRRSIQDVNYWKTEAEPKWQQSVLFSTPPWSLIPSIPSVITAMTPIRALQALQAPQTSPIKLSIPPWHPVPLLPSVKPLALVTPIVLQRRRRYLISLLRPLPSL
jgi:hypothetical protein